MLRGSCFQTESAAEPENKLCLFTNTRNEALFRECVEEQRRLYGHTLAPGRCSFPSCPVSASGTATRPRRRCRGEPAAPGQRCLRPAEPQGRGGQRGAFWGSPRPGAPHRTPGRRSSVPAPQRTACGNYPRSTQVLPSHASPVSVPQLLAHSTRRKPRDWKTRIYLNKES